MARFGERLSWVSWDGRDPQLSLTDEDWTEIEGAHGSALSQDLRCELLKICQRYLFDVRSEREAGMETDVRAHASRLKKSMKAFVEWSYGVRPPSLIESLTDTYREFDHRLETWLTSRSIGIGPQNLEFDEAIPDYVENWLRNNRLALVLDLHVVVEMAIRISSGLAAIEAGRSTNSEEGEARGFVPGQSWKTFLLAAHDFARSSNLPRALYVDGGTTAAAFPKMLFALNSKFPKEFKNTVASASALAKQLQRLRERDK
ncbi:hypothetical protein GOD47_01430 [Sinorhizobium medicae]|nr:hypothetical protein [Sinorhizobium medicae]MDX0662667.1 hypothetical protein [Sinorhizobium medicae]MDX0723727.1 hypothetical protein [Sinorhizobium medicae]MDX0729793.1 hypothetical protein [Sinorhizobium medicae]MDX0809882.1 hypothetical protein [Sinorhizobium medicae]